MFSSRTIAQVLDPKPLTLFCFFADPLEKDLHFKVALTRFTFRCDAPVTRIRTVKSLSRYLSKYASASLGSMRVMSAPFLRSQPIIWSFSSSPSQSNWLTRDKALDPELPIVLTILFKSGSISFFNHKRHFLLLAHSSQPVKRSVRIFSPKASTVQGVFSFANSLRISMFAHFAAISSGFHWKLPSPFGMAVGSTLRSNEISRQLNKTLAHELVGPQHEQHCHLLLHTVIESNSSWLLSLLTSEEKSWWKINVFY